jgi:hypothetical protein
MLLINFLILQSFLPNLVAFGFTSRKLELFTKSVIVRDNHHVKARSDDIDTTANGNKGNFQVSSMLKRKTLWLDQSISYYSKVMREERRRNLGQVKDLLDPGYQEEFETLAKKHYFALRKIKDGKPRHAELIYRRIIDELLQEEDGHCDHAKLAVTTLLLALLLQRTGDRKATRSVFLSFFRVAVLEREEGTECACSAKVLQAYALFEMKQGNARKSFELVTKAIQMDRSLEPVLQWKQFRDVLERKSLHA